MACADDIDRPSCPKHCELRHTEARPDSRDGAVVFRADPTADTIPQSSLAECRLGTEQVGRPLEPTLGAGDPGQPVQTVRDQPGIAELDADPQDLPGRPRSPGRCPRAPVPHVPTR